MSVRDVYIVAGNRTPFLKARGRPGAFSAADLALYCCRELLARQPFAPHELGEVIAGCVVPSEDEANIARIVALRLGCGDAVPAFTVQRNCGSGLQAIDNARQAIALGRHELVLAGGVEVMSRAPLLYSPELVQWLAAWQHRRGWGERLKLFAQFKPKFLSPVIALLHGLTDPVVGLSMGQTAEVLAERFHISRADMDEFALASHQRWLAAYQQGHYQEITPIFDRQGRVYAVDDGVRADTTLEKLASLKPFFDKKFGLVTAGNSSQVTDGAAFVLLASAAAVKKYQLPVLGKIIDVQWAGLDPKQMGLGPVHAMVPLLARQQLACEDIDYWEINEAFAGQVLACLRALASADYCRNTLQLAAPFGQIDHAKLNIDGGAIGIGHPIGASGARIVLHLLQVLKRQQARRGVAALCIGGGQGGAALLENVAVVN